MAWPVLAQVGLPSPALAPINPIARGAYYLQLGNAFAAWEQWPAAFNLYRAAVEANRHNLRAQVCMARALFRLGRAPEAVEAARRGLAAMPQDPEAIRVYAGANLGVGEVGLAESALRSLLATNPRDADALRLLGALLRQTHRLPAAEETLRSAVAIAPADADAWLELARTADDRGSERDARNYLERVVALRPNNLAAVSALVQLYLKNNRPDQALTVSLAALAHSPRQPDLLLGTGRLLAESNRPDEAAVLFRRAYDLNLPPVTMAASTFLGEYSMGQRDYIKAAEYASAALRLQPDLAPARAMLVAAQVARSNYSGAVDAMTPLVKAQPSNPSLQLRYTELALRAHRYPLAVEAVRGLLNRFADNPQIVGAAVTLLIRAGRTKDVAALLDKASRAHPRAPHLAYLSYSALRHSGQSAQAQALLANLAKRFPNDAQVRRETGLASYTKGDWAGTRRVLTPLFEARQIDREAVVALGWANQFLGRYQDAARVFSVMVSPTNPAPIFDVARQFDLAGNPLKAAELYGQLLETKRYNGYAALLGRARALANGGELAKALPLFEQLTAKYPGDMLAARGQIMALVLLQRPAEAQAVADALVKRRPKDALSYQLAGNLDEGRAAWNDAVQTYLAGVTAVPASAALQTRLGDALLASDAEPALAAARYEQAAALNPRDWYARYRLADLELAAGDAKRSAKLWRDLFDRSPDAAWSYTGWLRALAQGEGPELALAAGAQYLAEPNAKRLRGEALTDFAVDHGLLGSLLQHLGPVMNGSQATAAQRDTYGLALLRSRQSGQALEFYQRQAERERLNPLWAKRLGQAYELAGQPTAARDQYRRARQTGGLALDDLSLLAKVEAATGEAQAAIERLEQALRANPNNYLALANLVATYRDAGLLDRVVPKFTDLVVGDPARGIKPVEGAAESPNALTALGFALESAGQTYLARQRYQQALDLDPRAVWARGGLERVQGPTLYRQRLAPARGLDSAAVSDGPPPSAEPTAPLAPSPLAPAKPRYWR